MSYLETPSITATVPRELGPVLEYLQYVPHASPSIPSNELRRLMIAYVIMHAVAFARERVLLESDLNTLVPKPLRDYALILAVEHGLLKKTDWKGKPAWNRA